MLPRIGRIEDLLDALPRLKDALDASHGLRPTAIKQETQDKPVLLSLTPEIAPYLNIFNNRNFTSREIEGDSIIAKVVRFQAIEAFNSLPYIPRLKARGLYGDLRKQMLKLLRNEHVG